MRAAAGAVDAPRGEALRLLLLLDLGYLLVHLWGAGLEHGPAAAVSADAAPFGLVAPLQLMAAAVVLAAQAARDRSVGLGLAGLAAAVLAAAELSGLRAGKIVATGMLALAALPLAAPALRGDLSARGVAWQLLRLAWLLGSAALLIEVLTAGATMPGADLVEETLETAATALLLSASLPAPPVPSWDNLPRALQLQHGRTRLGHNSKVRSGGI